VLERAEVRQRGKERGLDPFLLFLLGLSGGVWAGEAGDRQQGVLRVRRRTRTYGEAVIYSRLGFTEFRPQGVRSNARMKLNFENLKSATVGCQDIS
jgi:hypothetical protein